MECLYCHKRLGFFASKKRPFCSELHEVAYQDEQQGLALRRVLDPLFTDPVRKAPLQQGPPPGGSLGTTARHQVPPVASLASPPRMGPIDAQQMEDARHTETPVQPDLGPKAHPDRSLSANHANGEIHPPAIPPPFESFLGQLQVQPVALDTAIPTPLPALEEPSTRLEFPRNGTLIEDTWDGLDRITGAPFTEPVEDPELPLQGLLAQFPVPAIRPEDLDSPEGPLDLPLPISSNLSPQPLSRYTAETLSEPQVGVALMVANHVGSVAETAPPAFETLAVEFEFPAIRSLVRNVWKWAIAEPARPLSLAESGLSISQQLPDLIAITEDPSRAIEGPDDLTPSTSPQLELLEIANHAANLLMEPTLGFARPVAPLVALVGARLPVLETPATAIEFPIGRALIGPPDNRSSGKIEGPLEPPAVIYRISAILPPAVVHSSRLEALEVKPVIAAESPALSVPASQGTPGLSFARMIAGHPTPPTEGSLWAFRIPGTEVDFPRSNPEIAEYCYAINTSLPEAPSVPCRVHAAIPSDADSSIGEADFPASHPHIADSSYSIDTSLAEAPSVPCQLHAPIPFEEDSNLVETPSHRSPAGPAAVPVAISRNWPAWIPPLRQSLLFGALSDGETLLPRLRPESEERDQALGRPDGELSPKPSAPVLPSPGRFLAIAKVTRLGSPAEPKSWNPRQSAGPVRSEEPEPLDLPWRPATPGPSLVPFSARVEEGPAVPHALPVRPVAGKPLDFVRATPRAKLLRPADANLRMPRLFFPMRESDLAAWPLSASPWIVSSSPRSELPIVGLQFPVTETRVPEREDRSIAAELLSAEMQREVWVSPAPQTSKSPVEGPSEFAYRMLSPVLQTRMLLAPKRNLAIRKLEFELPSHALPDYAQASFFADSCQLQPFRAASRIQIREPELDKLHHYSHLPSGIHAFAWRSFPMIAGPHSHGAPLPLRRPPQTPPVR